jgi:hypothetical protein
VKGKRKLTVKDGGFFGQFDGFQPPGQVAKSLVQIGLVIIVSELEEELPDQVGLLLGVTDNVHGLCEIKLPQFQSFEEETVELLAVLRAIGIDLAAALLPGNARLTELTCGNGKTEGAQVRGFVAELQSHLSKDNSVATEAALQTKLRGIRRFQAGV